MNLYQTQHPFYCGIDLHANEMYACVVDQSGKKLLHRNFKTRQPEKLFEKLEPYGTDVIVGCESTLTGTGSATPAKKKNPLHPRPRPVSQSDPRWQSKKR